MPEPTRFTFTYFKTKDPVTIMHRAIVCTVPDATDYGATTWIHLESGKCIHVVESPETVHRMITEADPENGVEVVTP